MANDPRGGGCKLRRKSSVILLAYRFHRKLFIIEYLGFAYKLCHVIASHFKPSKRFALVVLALFASEWYCYCSRLE